MAEWIVDSVKTGTTSGKEVLFSIKGRNLYSGEPKELSINSEDLSLYWKSFCIVNRRNKHCLEIESHLNFLTKMAQRILTGNKSLLKHETLPNTDNQCPP